MPYSLCFLKGKLKPNGPSFEESHASVLVLTQAMQKARHNQEKSGDAKCTDIIKKAVTSSQFFRTKRNLKHKDTLIWKMDQTVERGYIPIKPNLMIPFICGKQKFNLMAV